MKLLNIKLKKLIYGKYSGNFSSPIKGEGMEIEDFREYQQGDDASFINWKLSAKHNEFFINLFKQEKDATIHLFFDINYNWKGGEKRPNKQNIFDTILKIFLFGKRYGIRMVGHLHDHDKKKLRHYKLQSSLHNGYWLIKKLEEQINKQSKRRHKSNLQTFLNYQMSTGGKDILIIFSDFLEMKEEVYKKLLKTKEKKEVILVKIPVPYFFGTNFDRYSINTDKIKHVDKLLKKFNITKI